MFFHFFSATVWWLLLAKLPGNVELRQAPPIKRLKAARVTPDRSDSQQKKKKTAIKVLTMSHEASCCKHGVTAEGDLDECICICIKSECYFHFDYDSGAVEDAAKRGRSDFPRIFVIGRSVLFFWWECKQANAQKQSNVGSFFGSPLFFLCVICRGQDHCLLTFCPSFVLPTAKKTS